MADCPCPATLSSGFLFGLVADLASSGQACGSLSLSLCVSLSLCLYVSVSDSQITRLCSLALRIPQSGSPGFKGRTAGFIIFYTQPPRLPGISPPPQIHLQGLLSPCSVFKLLCATRWSSTPLPVASCCRGWSPASLCSLEAQMSLYLRLSWSPWSQRPLLPAPT